MNIYKKSDDYILQVAIVGEYLKTAIIGIDILGLKIQIFYVRKQYSHKLLTCLEGKLSYECSQ